MAREAGQKALEDCNLRYEQVDAAVVSYCYCDPTAGQRAMYELGLTGIPIFNTNNNCSSASSALMLAKLLVQSGQYHCVMALGFEKMERGLSRKYTDKVDPLQRHYDHMEKLGGKAGAEKHMNDVTANIVKLFCYAADEHSEKYGSTKLQLAKISHKNHFHSQYNPYASLQKVFSLESISSSPCIFGDKITMKMSGPTGDGSAAVVVCSEDFIKKHRLTNNAVEIIAQHMVTDLSSTFGNTFRDLCGVDMAKKAADMCYRDSGLKPKDVDVIELHDCFSCNEMLMYEALGLADEGCGGKLIDEARWITNLNGGKQCLLGNRWVVNPSGGLESKGHPIGATGLAQCAEINWQLRNLANQRQVDNAKVGMQHNFGIGGAAVVTLFQKYSENSNTQRIGIQAKL